MQTVKTFDFGCRCGARIIERKTFFVICAEVLAAKEINFQFHGRYLTCAAFNLSTDYNNAERVWIESSGVWQSFDVEDGAAVKFKARITEILDAYKF